MKNNYLLLIVRTALLIAITLMFQQLRLIIGVSLPSTLVIGSLVNLALFVTAATVGWRGSVFVAILSPVVASLQGHLPHTLLIPFVALGNLTLVLAFELMLRRPNKPAAQWIAVAGTSLLKTVVLYGSITLLFVPVILPGLAVAPKAAQAMAVALPVNFSWPQLVTALVGGAAAIPVIKRLRVALDAREKQNGR